MGGESTASHCSLLAYACFWSLFVLFPYPANVLPESHASYVAGPVFASNLITLVTMALMGGVLVVFRDSLAERVAGSTAAIVGSGALLLACARARCQRRCRSGPALDDGCLPRHHGALRRSGCPGPRGGIAALDPSGQRRRACPFPAPVVPNRRGHRGAYGSPAHRRHLKPPHVRPERYLPGDSRPLWLRCPQSTASVPPRAVPFGGAPPCPRRPFCFATYWEAGRS